MAIIPRRTTRRRDVNRALHREMYENKGTRWNFLKKLAFVLVVVLGVMMAFVFTITRDSGFNTFVSDPENTYMSTGALILAFGTFALCGFLLHFKRDLVGECPFNTLIILGMVLSSAVVISIAWTAFEMSIILVAMGIQTLSCVGFALFSFSTDSDPGTCNGDLHCLLWGVLAVIAMIPMPSSMSPIKYLGGFVGVFSVFRMSRDIRSWANDPLPRNH